MDSQKLLADFVGSGSEDAFRCLVSRYTGLVYSTALRLVDGNREVAQDVAQMVFIDLARKARSFSGEVMLGGWLHRHTCFVAATALRSERRRQSRERQAVEMNAIGQDSEPGSKQIAGILDEAINQLGTDDRTAILLRYFERYDLRAVGQALGTNENAARMRVTRAVEKLQALLAHRGVSLSAAAVTAALAADSLAAAPLGLAAILAQSALAAGPGSGGVALTATKIIAMTKIKLGLIGVLAAAGVAVPFWAQHASLMQARSDNDSLKRQVELLDRANAENERLSNLLAQASAPSPQFGEVLKLRGEVNRLRRELTEKSKEQQHRTAAVANPPAAEDTAEAQKQWAILKMGYSGGWAAALMQYANQHGGQLPTNFESAAPFLSSEVTAQTNLRPDQFEIVYRGSVNELTNPQSIIVIREMEAWPTPDGAWARDYSFADGHSEIHKSADGNFQPWEAQHGVPVPVPAPIGQ